MSPQPPKPVVRFRLRTVIQSKDALHDIRDTLPVPAGKAVSPLLVDSRTAAKLLAVSERTLWSLTASGEVRCVRIGRAVRYAISDLSAYVERLRAAAK